MIDADGLLAVRSPRPVTARMTRIGTMCYTGDSRARPRRSLVAVVAVIVGLVAALAATPALGLVRDIIPFWGAAKAPQRWWLSSHP